MAESSDLNEDTYGDDWPVVYKSRFASTKEEKIEAVRNFFGELKRRVGDEARRLIVEEAGHMFADTSRQGGYFGIKQKPESSEFRPFYHVEGLRTVQEAERILTANPELMSDADKGALQKLLEIRFE